MRQSRCYSTDQSLVFFRIFDLSMGSVTLLTLCLTNTSTTTADRALHAITDVSAGSLLPPALQRLCLSISRVRPRRPPMCFYWPMIK